MHRSCEYVYEACLPMQKHEPAVFLTVHVAEGAFARALVP